MQNHPKSFWVAIISTTLLALVVIGGVIYFHQKNSLSNTNTYTDQLGIYSFKYPTDWVINTQNSLEVPSVVQIVIPGNDAQGRSFELIAFVDVNDRLLSMLLDPKKLTEEVFGKVDGFSTDRYLLEFSSNTNLRLYVIHLRETEGAKANLVVYSNYPYIEGVVKTIRIDKANLTTTLQKVQDIVIKSVDTARQKGKDAQIKATISQFRAQAEIYYDKGSTYVGICTKDAGAKNLLESFAPTVATCKDSVKAYAVTAPLVTEGFFCADSTGYAGSVKALNTTTACAR